MPLPTSRARTPGFGGPIVVLDPRNRTPLSTRRGNMLENGCERARVVRHRAEARRRKLVLGVDDYQGLVHHRLPLSEVLQAASSGPKPRLVLSEGPMTREFS